MTFSVVQSHFKRFYNLCFNYRILCRGVHVYTCLRVYVCIHCVHCVQWCDAVVSNALRDDTFHRHTGENSLVLTWRSSQSIRLTARRPALLPTYLLSSVCLLSIHRPNMAYNVFSGTLNPTAPFTRHNLLSNRLSTGSTGCIVYTNIQPVVKLVWQPVGCLFTRYSRLSNRLYNPVWQPVWQPFDNRFDNKLYRVNGA